MSTRNPARSALRLGSLLLPALAFAQSQPLDRLDRLQILAGIWSKVYVYHPRIAAGSLDYNSVLLKAIPFVENARSDAEFVQVLNDAVLGPLQDPQTLAQLATADRCGPAPIGAPQPLDARKLSASTGLLRIHDQRIQSDRVKPVLNVVKSAAVGLGSIDKLVIDLRYHYDHPTPAWSDYWLGLLISEPLDRASYLRRIHHGFNEFNSSSNWFRQRWYLDGEDTLNRARWNGIAPDPMLQPVLFLVNNASYHQFSRDLDTLQRAGRAAVLLEDTGCVSGHDVENYPGNIRVQMNTTLLAGGRDGQGARPDRLSRTRIEEGQIAGIADEMLGALRPVTSGVAGMPPLRFHAFTSPPESLANREQRIFWLIKTWMAIRYFFPHLEYASIDWHTALREWIPRAEAATNYDEFLDVVRQLTARLNDSHIRLNPPRGHPLRIAHYPPIRLGRADGKTVVTFAGPEVRDLIKPGDEVLAIAGKDVGEVERYMRLRVSASTEGAFHKAWNEQTRGPKDSALTFTLSRNGQPRTVELRRTYSQMAGPRFERTRDLRGGVGYLNLFTVRSETELEEAFVKVRHARGLVMDLRGYPNYANAPKVLVSRLVTQPAKTILSKIPLLFWADDASFQQSFLESYDFIQPRPSEHYSGPVVVLINSEAQSNAEAVAQELKGTGRVTFVGSPTTGTNGGQAPFDLPGGWVMSFTGERVTHKDGSRFQNVGVVPDVHVEPTILGLAAGVDEVLEKGIDVLLTKLPAVQ